MQAPILQVRQRPPYYHTGVSVEGRGEPRTNVSIRQVGVGNELASVFCDENGHFSAILKFTCPQKCVNIEAQCGLSGNNTSEWGPILVIDVV